MSLSKLEKQPSIFSYINLVHAIAGGCGSAFAMSTFYPLEIVKTKNQLESKGKNKNAIESIFDIYQEEGIPGLYRGLLPVVESLYCSNFVYFYSFHSLKRFLNEEKSAVKDLLLGMIAGSINVLTTTPLWVVNTRIKAQGITGTRANRSRGHARKYEGLLHGLLKISQEEGIPALWSGTLSSLILVINPAIQFMVYESLKRRSQGMSASKAFLAGAVAKAIATLITYPLQLVQARQRHGHNIEGLNPKAGIIPVLLYIMRLHGVRGLYKGLEAKMLQTVATAALMFVFYEKIARFVFSILMKSRGVSKR